MWPIFVGEIHPIFAGEFESAIWTRIGRLLVWQRGKSLPAYDLRLDVAINGLVASLISDQFITTDSEGTLCLWRASLGQIERTLLHGVFEPTAFARDGRC